MAKSGANLSRNLKHLPMNLTLEDKILLQFGDKRKHLRPHEIEAESTGKEVAISNLVKRGYVTAHENGSSMYDSYVSISITEDGNARQRELLCMMNRSRSERFGDGIRKVWRNVKPSTVRIVEVVMGGLIIAFISFWLGRITAP